jgi:hypothetical protein
MSTHYRMAGLLAATLACAMLPAVNAAEPKLPRDGWTSWQVPAVDGTPAWCCYGSWNESDDSARVCKLDESQKHYGTRDNHASTDAVKVYVRSGGGKIDRLQVLAAACPVETRTPVQPIDVGVDDSARWLQAQVKESRADAITGQPLGEGALAALAMHRGDLARDAMTEFARNDASAETRKRSVFWLSMLRGQPGADITSSVMFNDPDSDVREHAAFALSQSKSPRKAQDLIRLGNTDKVGSVRARAWFWLAQTGAEGAEQSISAALKTDADDEVREQGVFALSQLPGERATKSLIAVAEDRSLSSGQRKRAVFWLSQSKSDAAQAYLEKVLAAR